MYYVYLLQSINSPDKTYVGYTLNVNERIVKHNGGSCPYSNKYKPWQLIACFAFKYKARAIAFEEYLKSGSGRSFAKNHFW